MRKRVIMSIVLVVVGLAIVFGVPTAYEGPMLLYINEQHAIRLVDALGLVVMVPAWLYFNLLALRVWTGRRKPNNCVK